ncbi:MAG TPA: nuclear transport factor 2 family protein [Woeseiaceae bacterium]|nr:nuclear transport factor 2 family protein [Woeseiaceae bacterium]
MNVGIPMRAAVIVVAIVAGSAGCTRQQGDGAERAKANSAEVAKGEGAVAAKADSAEAAKEERNKELVVAFYNAAINDKDFEAASAYLGNKYTQHNPLAADGPEGLKAFLEFAKESLPDFKAEIKQVFADGDYVILHVHATRGPDDRGSAVMDIFRLEGDKVVEHWDVIQPIPETSANDNTMF